MVNFLDLAIAAALAFFLIRGIFRGFFLEAASIAGVVAAFYLASGYHDELAPFFERWIKSPAIMRMIAYGVIFAGTMFCVSLLARLISAILRINPAPWLSLTGGALLGLGKGLVISLVALSTLSAYLPDAEFMQNSLAAKYLKPGVERVDQYRPGSMTGFDPDAIRRQIQENKGKALEQFLGTGSPEDHEQAPQESPEN
jgi:membrane protein required for colicin V production